MSSASEHSGRSARSTILRSRREPSGFGSRRRLFDSESLIDQLVDALVDVRLRLELPFAGSLLAAE
jgi:hypothetical protein